MRKEDFSVGQTVWLQLLNNAARGKSGEELIRKAKVVTVGRKYLTVAPGYFSDTVKFDLQDFKEVSNYADDHKLFLTRQEVADDIEKGQLIVEIARDVRSMSFSSLSLDQLRKIKEILEKCV